MMCNPTGIRMFGPSDPRVACFGDFVVDLQTGELFKNGKKLRLQVQLFQVLALLLERPGELVSRDELRAKLWPDNTFVDFDDGLNTAIGKLRRLLCDSTEHPQYIETLPRRGYRFIAPVTMVSPPHLKPAPPVSERVSEDPSAAGKEDGVIETPAVSRAPKRWMLAAIAVLLGLGVVALPIARKLRERVLPSTTSVHIRSIAVLPLEDLSDPAQKLFTDGMTDTLVTELGQISSLRVLAGASMIRYQGTRKTPQDIARELKQEGSAVDAVVTGTMVKSAGHVRVNAQLVEAPTDRQLWAHSYESSQGDAVTLQGEVARAIAAAIQVKLTPQEQVRLETRRPVDPRALEFYLRGHHFAYKWTDVSARKSIEYFEQATKIDSNYALAYAGIAEEYSWRDDLPPSQECEKARAAASKALQIDAGLPEPHMALANCLYWYDWKWEEAEREFQRAIALNPNFAMAHQFYGQLLRFLGRDQEWEAEEKRARELDPVKFASGSGVAIFRGNYDKAIEEMRKLQDFDPNDENAYLTLGRAYRGKGMYGEAIEVIKKGINVSEGDPKALSELGYTYALSDQRDKAQEMVHQLTSLSKRSYVRPYNIAKIYVGLSEKDLAFEWLEKAFAEHSVPIGRVFRTEECASLRSDPRYSELRRRIGLPQ
jgi:TolB-like protein/DNA-binding winged helix-turn-helix (wHTH) protein/Flp pilus assembly protein TadD